MAGDKCASVETEEGETARKCVFQGLVLLYEVLVRLG
jgi:hypothetical protein